MDLKAELDSSQMRRMAAAIERAPDIALDELTRFLAHVTPHIYSEVVERTPTSGVGNLRNSISYQVRPVGRRRRHRWHRVTLCGSSGGRHQTSSGKP